MSNPDCIVLHISASVTLFVQPASPCPPQPALLCLYQPALPQDAHPSQHHLVCASQHHPKASIPAYVVLHVTATVALSIHAAPPCPHQPVSPYPSQPASPCLCQPASPQGQHPGQQHAIPNSSVTRLLSARHRQKSHFSLEDPPCPPLTNRQACLFTPILSGSAPDCRQAGAQGTGGSELPAQAAAHGCKSTSP